MKIHKTDEKRIYFLMDSGAYGSISREDVVKLLRCRNHLWKEKVDPRTPECLSEKAEQLRIEEMRNYMEYL